MSVPVHAGAPPTRARARTADDMRANDLVVALAVLPADGPGRARLRNEVIEAWLPMSRRLSRRYAHRGEPSEDLQQVAAVGLIKAVDRFDPRVCPDFAGFAVPTIVGEVKRYFRDRGWAVRVPRRLQEIHLAIGRAHADLCHMLDRSPTVADIAGHLGVGEEAVLEGLEAGHTYRAISLSAPVRDDSNRALGDTIAAHDSGFELADFAVALPPAMICLTERERQIISWRFYGNLTQSDIAQRVGVSQMHVSRLLAGALIKLRAQMS